MGCGARLRALARSFRRRGGGPEAGGGFRCHDRAGAIERKLTAILAADVAGYSRLMGLDEVGTIRLLAEHREVLDGLVAEHGGRIVNCAGDSILAEFPSAVDAIECAAEAQARLARANEGLPAGRRLEFRIGVHVGDVVVRGGDLFGDGVNIAARLQALAEPGGVCISGAGHEHVRKHLPQLRFADLGPKVVKNIDEPVRAYILTPPGGAGPEPADRPKPLPLPDQPSIAVLPFTNMSGDPEQEYFADGLVEDIITALSRVQVVLRHRAQLLLHLQGPAGGRAAGLARARRPLCPRGQHPQGRPARADHRPAGRRDHRAPCLGRSIRRRPERHLRAAGPGDGKRGRARSSQASGWRRSGRPARSRPATSPPTISTCGPCRASTA